MFSVKVPDLIPTQAKLYFGNIIWCRDINEEKPEKGTRDLQS